MNREEKNFFLIKPLIVFFLILSFLVISYLLFVHSGEEIDFSDASPLFKNRKIFSHLHKSQNEEISYTVKTRESLNRNNIHRVYFYIEVPSGTSQEQLKLIAQKVVGETISVEICHSINIDFGPYGYVDFAPYGNWAKAGDVPVGDYKEYRFKYYFSSFLFSE